MADLLEGINPLALDFPEAEEPAPAEDPRDVIDYCDYLETAIENEKRLIGSLAGQEGKEGELAKHAARLKALKARLAKAEEKALGGDEWPDVGGLRERGDLVSYDLDTCAECGAPIEDGSCCESKDGRRLCKECAEKAGLKECGPVDEDVCETDKVINHTEDEEPLEEAKGDDVKAKLKAWLSKASSDEPIAESKKEEFPGSERLKKHLKKASNTEPIVEGKEDLTEGQGGLVDEKGAPREDLPKCVREYIVAHPNATVKELADWYDAHCKEESLKEAADGDVVNKLAAWIEGGMEI